MQALATQTSVVGWRLERPAEALALANVARGLLARVPKDVRLEALLDEAEGDARWVAADNTASLAAYQRALDGLLTLHIADDADVSRVRGAIAWLLMEQGALGAARREFGLAMQSRERLLGAGHPLSASLWSNVGELDLAFGDFAAAVASFENAFAVYLRVKGPTASSTVGMELLTIRSLLGLSRLPEAVRRLSSLEQTLGAGPDAPSTQLTLRQVRAEVALASGQGREAIGLAAEALRRCEEALRPVHLECAFTELTLARAHLAAADAERTLTLATDSAHRFEQLSATRTRKYSEALVVKVDALKALARPADALAATEQLVTALSAIEGNTDLKVSAGLRLAEAHWKGAADRPRAITVAERALELATEAQRPELAAEATTWLSTHHLP